VLPVPPGRPPLPLPVWGPLKPPFEAPPRPPLDVDEPPTPFDEPPRGIAPLPVDVPGLDVLELLEVLEPFEALEPVCPFALAGLLFVVVLFRPPVVAVCATMRSPGRASPGCAEAGANASARPRKTAVVILSSGLEAAFSDGEWKARPHVCHPRSALP